MVCVERNCGISQGTIAAIRIHQTASSWSQTLHELQTKVIVNGEAETNTYRYVWASF